MPMTDEQRAQLEAFREARAAKAAAEVEAEEMHELEVETLTDELSKSLGKENHDFKIVDNQFGLFAVRKPDIKAVKAWENAGEDKRLNLEWNISYLRHYIVPTEKALSWCQLGTERPGLVWQTTSAFIELMGVDRKLLAKK